MEAERAESKGEDAMLLAWKVEQRATSQGRRAATRRWKSLEKLSTYGTYFYLWYKW